MDQTEAAAEMDIQEGTNSDANGMSIKIWWQNNC